MSNSILIAIGLVSHLVALLHLIYTIRKKITVLRFPIKYEPVEKFYVLQIYYSV